MSQWSSALLQDPQSTEGTMQDRPISGDKHIDLTYCPPDLWSAQAPAKWRRLVPRVEELEDGPADSIRRLSSRGRR